MFTTATPTQFLSTVLLRKSVAFLMQGNALALQGIAKLNLLRINEMLYLDQSKCDRNDGLFGDRTIIIKSYRLALSQVRVITVFPYFED
ncbi:hypothetical protein [Nostoc sp.]|uniref:hypothetical protein n=1 Tax=Nostoc sp. TaxID=1180 RepID=UPI002FF48842